VRSLTLEKLGTVPGIEFRARQEGQEMSEDRYKKALAAISEEVNKIIAYEETPPEVQCVLDTIEAICQHGADVRTEVEKQWRPETAHEIDDEDAIDGTGKPVA
jgi:ribonuclease D